MSLRAISSFFLPLFPLLPTPTTIFFDQKALDFSVEVVVLYCVAYPTLHMLLCLIRDYTERTKALTHYFMFIHRSGFLSRKVTYQISHSRSQTVTFRLGMSN